MSGVSGSSGFVVGVALIAAFAGCTTADESNEVRDGEQEEAFCDANCRRDGYCRGSNRYDPCMAHCRANVSGLEDFRPEAVRLIRDCILEIRCSDFYDENSFVPCWEEAEREIEPDASVRRFCFAWSTRWFECGSSYSTERCERDWGLFSDDFLERMSRCLEVECGEIEACTQAIRGGA